MKKKEIIVFSIIILCSIVAILLITIFSKNSELFVRVTIDEEVFGQYSLNENQEIEIESEYGINTLKIYNNYADIIYADCENKICVNTKKARNIGDIIVCLPHKTIIEIVNED